MLDKLGVYVYTVSIKKELELMQIYTTDQTRTRLEQLAILAGPDASMSGVIKRLVDQEWERCNLVSITTLPHPEDAKPIPVVAMPSEE
jgi:hypothetical protein